jgi:hypothetical protein
MYFQLVQREGPHQRSNDAAEVCPSLRPNPRMSKGIRD